MKKAIIYSLFIIAIGIFSFSVGELYGQEKNDIVTEPAAVVATEGPVVGDVVFEEESITDVIDEALPSVVGIASSSNGMRSLGSGVIVSRMGYIVTNHHVVGSSPERIDVTLYDGSVKEAEVLWSDRALDLAALKIDGENYASAKLGESDDVKVGEDVIAIGNPLSLQFERSVTKGIVSATGRTLSVDVNGETLYMEDLIQTDASINPGNSGGPLMNERGEVIGINTVRVKDAEGMGFAVPVCILESIVKKLEETGKFETPYLGLYACTAREAKYLKKDGASSDGLYVMSLDTDGPAYEAGLRFGDIIKKIDGKEVDTMIGLRRTLFQTDAGSEITLEISRKGEKMTIYVESALMETGYLGSNQ